MSTDIKLDEHHVIVEGRILKVQAWDLQLDHPDRRKKDTPHRRALVHDFNDGLTANWGEDYPGGITLNGVREITGWRVNVPYGKAVLISGNLVCNGRVILYRDGYSGPTPTALTHDGNDRLVINQNENFQGGVRIEGPVVVSKSLNMGDVSESTRRRVGGRLRLPPRNADEPAADGPQTGTISVADQPGAAVDATPSSAHAVLEFDIVDELMQALNEIGALKERVAALEKQVGQP